jgi:hypothetical protein
MSLAGNPADQAWVTLGNPPKRKKRGLGSRVSENFQEAIGVLLNPARQRIPKGTINDSVKCQNMEIVFHVDRHRIEDMLFVSATANFAQDGLIERPDPQQLAGGGRVRRSHVPIGARTTHFLERN